MAGGTTLALAFGAVALAGLLLSSGLRNRSLGELLRGITSPNPEPLGEALGGGEAQAAPSSASSATPGSSHTAGGFLAPGEKLLEYARHDQGRDIRISPGAPIVAPGAGQVLRVGSDPSGFGPDYPIVHFTSGPEAGRDVYLGHTDTALPAGSHFSLGQVLAHTSRTGHNAPPGWAEIGYAPSGSPGPFGQPAPF
jgi:hypothetical protein